jgi:hypothetical protein
MYRVYTLGNMSAEVDVVCVPTMVAIREVVYTVRVHVYTAPPTPSVQVCSVVLWKIRFYKIDLN